MNAKQILDELKPLGQEGYKKIMLKHGAAEPCYGVKIEHLKKIQKRIKRDYQLALDLYDTGVYDARYLAGLIADDAKMTRKDLQRWADDTCEPLVRSTVAAVAAGSAHAWEVGLAWIDSKKELVAGAGWATLVHFVSITPNEKLDLAALKKLLAQVEKAIASAPNEVRYQMNGFMIAVGSYVPALTALVKETAKRIGKVSIDMGDTACEVPYAVDYIEKIEKRGSLGKKRASAKC